MTGGCLSFVCREWPYLRYRAAKVNDISMTTSKTTAESPTTSQATKFAVSVAIEESAMPLVIATGAIIINSFE